MKLYILTATIAAADWVSAADALLEYITDHLKQATGVEGIVEARLTSARVVVTSEED